MIVKTYQAAISNRLDAEVEAPVAVNLLYVVAIGPSGRPDGYKTTLTLVAGGQMAVRIAPEQMAADVKAAWVRLAHMLTGQA